MISTENTETKVFTAIFLVLIGVVAGWQFNKTIVSTFLRNQSVEIAGLKLIVQHQNEQLTHQSIYISAVTGDVAQKFRTVEARLAASTKFIKKMTTVLKLPEDKGISLADNLEYAARLSTAKGGN